LKQIFTLRTADRVPISGKSIFAHIDWDLRGFQLQTSLTWHLVWSVSDRAGCLENTAAVKQLLFLYFLTGGLTDRRAVTLVVRRSSFRPESGPKTTKRLRSGGRQERHGVRLLS